MTLMPQKEEVEEFVDRVSEVSRLIDGLRAGTLPVDYIDGKLKRRQEEQSVKAGPAKPEGAAKGAAPPSPPHAPGGAPPAQPAGAEADAEAEEERREKLMQKVQELKERRERKLRARERFNRHTTQQAKGVSSFGTDYEKWDLYCPTDEEVRLVRAHGAEGVLGAPLSVGGRRTT